MVFWPRVSSWPRLCSEQTCCAPRDLERLAWDPPEQKRPTWLVVWWPQMEGSRGGLSSCPQGEALPVFGKNVAVDDEKHPSWFKSQFCHHTDFCEDSTLRYPHRARLWKSDISDWNPGSATYLLCDLAQMSNLSVFVFCHEQSGSSHRYLHHRFVVRAEQVNPRY